MQIEDGYAENPYHSRVHAADVLRTLHVLLHRGGVLEAVSNNGQQQSMGDKTPLDSGLDSGQADSAAATRLLTCYIAAIVHDYEHR